MSTERLKRYEELCKKATELALEKLQAAILLAVSNSKPYPKPKVQISVPKNIMDLLKKYEIKFSFNGKEQYEFTDSELGSIHVFMERDGKIVAYMVQNGNPLHRYYNQPFEALRSCLLRSVETPKDVKQIIEDIMSIADWFTLVAEKIMGAKTQVLDAEKDALEYMESFLAINKVSS